jgi:hypothetical protein
LAAAFTTIFSALIMLFAVITFFRKFALVLFFTIIMATVGSFIVLLTLTDCFGPSQPTYLVDLIFDRISARCCNRSIADDSDDTNSNEQQESKGSTDATSPTNGSHGVDSDEAKSNGKQEASKDSADEALALQLDDNFIPPVSAAEIITG